MANYVIGDVQGCFDELQDLLRLIQFNPARDKLYFLGDLVNRGPGSLEVLRWAYRHRDVVDTVLGNHDLHLLAVQAGVSKIKAGDTLADVLTAPDCPVLIDWLQSRPLALRVDNCLLVHAGLMPMWSTAYALALSAEVQACLRGPQRLELLSQMYGNKPSAWSDALRGWDRLRLIINAFTRMRMLDQTSALDLSFKGELDDAPAGLRAWFDDPATVPRDETVLFGHWSALGLMQTGSAIALDTGCIWGGSLTAIRLADRKIYQVPSRQQVLLDPRQQ